MMYRINALSERNVTYDRNGSILSLTRYGADTAVPEEALAYSYNGNMLAGVSNSGSSGGGGAYAHDANGNLTRDGLSGLGIGYDDLNLTSRVSSGDTTLAEYGHLADGTKISSADGSGNGLQYRGSLVYTQTAGQSGSPALALDCALTTAGRIARVTAADGSVSYRSLIHLRDHLGSVRAVVDGDTGAVIEANDYYPFGKRIPLPVSGAVPVTEALSVTEPVEVTDPVEATVASTGSAASQNRWLFSGKESQSFLSASIPFLDFGARMYDPLTARWTAQDPLAEKYYAVSPYAYCLNNAVNSIDCDGKAVWFLPIVKGAIGAAVDAGAQITVSMSSGKSFTESLKLVDLTSVGTAFVTSAILSPGASKGVKAAAAGINVLDAGVDYSINEGAKTIFNKKDIEQAVVELSIDRISGTAAKRLQKAFMDDANAKLIPSFMAPLSKEEKVILRSNKEYVEGESFPIIIDNISSFTSGMVENGIVVFVIAPNNTENEE